MYQITMNDFLLQQRKEGAFSLNLFAFPVNKPLAQLRWFIHFFSFTIILFVIAYSGRQLHDYSVYKQLAKCTIAMCNGVCLNLTLILKDFLISFERCLRIKFKESKQ